MSFRNIHEVKFEWMPPSCPNGIICHYNFSISTASNISNFILSANETTKTVDGFEAYQLYTVEVIASTIVKGNLSDGPPAVLMEFTLPDSELFWPPMHTHTNFAFQGKIIISLSVCMIDTKAAYHWLHWSPYIS